MIHEELLVPRLMINQKLLHLEGIGLTNGSSLDVMTIKQSSSEKNNALSQIFFYFLASLCEQHFLQGSYYLNMIDLLNM